MHPSIASMKSEILTFTATTGAPLSCIGCLPLVGFFEACSCIENIADGPRLVLMNNILCLPKSPSALLLSLLAALSVTWIRSLEQRFVMRRIVSGKLINSRRTIDANTNPEAQAS